MWYYTAEIVALAFLVYTIPVKENIKIAKAFKE